jgi:hypothetical protein
MPQAAITASRTTTPRPILLSVALVAVTIAAGLAIRFAPLGLPHFLAKYGGSALWALMIYWIVSTILPTRRVAAVALFAAVIATAVEFGKLVHFPALDAFRLTLPGILLLGRLFSVWDIAAYCFAIFLGALIDIRLRKSISRTTTEPEPS